MNCSRCNSPEPNPECHVCWEDKASREADYGDYLRDELRDRQWEENQEEKQEIP